MTNFEDWLKTLPDAQANDLVTWLQGRMTEADEDAYEALREEFCLGVDSIA